MGFKNEFIISMLCRFFKQEDLILSTKSKMRHVYFLVEGACTLYDDQSTTPQIQLQPGTWYGDWHVLNDIRSEFTLKAEPPQEKL